MQIRLVRLNSRNPLVAILVIAIVLALLAFVLTAGLALAAGGAVLGAVGYLARRVFGGRAVGGGPETIGRERIVMLGEEVFPPSVAQVPEAESAVVLPPSVGRLKEPDA